MFRVIVCMSISVSQRQPKRIEKKTVCDQICSFEPCSVYFIRERERYDDYLLDDELSTTFQVNQGDRLRLHEQILLPVFWLTVRLIVRFA